MLDTTQWKWHRIGDLFDLEIGKNKSQENLPDGEGYFYVGAKKGNNGVMLECGYDPSLISKGNCIVFICNGQGSVGYANYMDIDFIATSDVVMGYSEHLTTERGLFLVTVIDMERPKYSFGRKWKIHLEDTQIKLPTTRNGSVDWMWIDSYMSERMAVGGPRTSNPSRKNAIDTTEWQTFELRDIFDIHYGVNLEYLNCVEVEPPVGVNFVSRTAANSGVSGRVLEIDGIDPEKAGTITIAGGGSVLSTFLQKEPYYSGRDLYVCETKDELNDAQKLFLCTLIRREVYRYSYGRQANKTLPFLRIKLPVTQDGAPDWAWINSYMKSLPYGDMI